MKPRVQKSLTRPPREKKLKIDIPEVDLIKKIIEQAEEGDYVLQKSYSHSKRIAGKEKLSRQNQNHSAVVRFTV